MDSILINQLLRPEAFDHPGGDIELLETHISWIVLSGDFAYKIKKPVSLEFLDFSSSELRRHYCEEELRLNRRFAPELYLAVVPITLCRGLPTLNGTGTPIDHAVKMRRIPKSELLEDMTKKRGELDAGLVRKLAAEMARLHATLPHVLVDPGSDEPGTPGALQAAMTQNFRLLDQPCLGTGVADQLQIIRRWWCEHFARLRTAMASRIQRHRVIDGHGDTHIGNVAVINGQVRFFDCIEFNRSFRVLDSIGEIALMSMDLTARGHRSESNRLVSDYLEYRGDYDGVQLLRLYQCYFALVRAKVNLLRVLGREAEPPAHPDSADYRPCRDYIDLADSCRRAGKPFLAITHGVSGSGKSTVAGEICGRSGAIRLRSDVERKRLAGIAPEQRSDPGQTRSLYSASMGRKTFDRLIELTRSLLAQGFPTIVDATFLHRRVRSRFAALAFDLGIPFVILDCDIPAEELRRRLTERENAGTDASDAGVAVMEQQLQQREPLTAEERARSVTAASQLEQVWQDMQALLAEQSRG